MHKKNINDHFRDECSRRLAFRGYWRAIVDASKRPSVDGTTLFGKPVIRQANTVTVQRKN